MQDLNCGKNSDPAVCNCKQSTGLKHVPCVADWRQFWKNYKAIPNLSALYQTLQFFLSV